jgi:RNA polymerase sigma-70 factor, ECF subfamily
MTSSFPRSRVLQGVEATVALRIGETKADDRVRLFDVHERRLFRLARRLSASHDEAADLVQETFVRALSSRSRPPDAEAEQDAWLVTVMVNLARDRARRQGVRTRAAVAPNDVGTRDPEAGYVARIAVQDALGRLDVRRRAIVVLHELEGESIARIASLLGIASVTVRWHLTRAKKELATLLAVERRNDSEIG